MTWLRAIPDAARVHPGGAEKLTDDKWDYMVGGAERKRR
jgi:hypothetical protein